MFSTALKIVDSYDSHKENKFSEKTNLFKLGKVVNDSRKCDKLSLGSTYREETGFQNFKGEKWKVERKFYSVQQLTNCFQGQGKVFVMIVIEPCENRKPGSSHQEVFCKKGVLKMFAKFKGNIRAGVSFSTL